MIHREGVLGAGRVTGPCGGGSMLEMAALMCGDRVAVAPAEL